MSWQGLFEQLADEVARHAGPDEGFTLALSAEDSAFVRFNQGRVRQPGDVRQARITLRWIDGHRHASSTLTLSGDLAADRRKLADEVTDLRALVRGVPEDPHLAINTTPHDTVSVPDAPLPDPATAVADICALADGLDLVGIYASGDIFRGFANHLGQRNAYTSRAALFDWSLVASGDKAVKMSYGGTRFDLGELEHRMAEGREQLKALRAPSRTIPPGRYRAYLAPSAVAEIMGLLSWDGFSCRGQRAGSSPLGRLVDGRERLDPRITLSEDTASGIGPDFQEDGFIKPGRVPLVEAGRHAGALVSPRSAREYGVDHNGADASEAPSALRMAGGDLPMARALEALGTGVWISNLWYLNHSDRNAGRFTGMTRFATFWVEDGRIAAPLCVMRFDDRIYEMFGESLADLTREVDQKPSAQTYSERSTSSVAVPGMLLHGMTFTL